MEEKVMQGSEKNADNEVQVHNQQSDPHPYVMEVIMVMDNEDKDYMSVGYLIKTPGSNMIEFNPHYSSEEEFLKYINSKEFDPFIGHCFIVTGPDQKIFDRKKISSIYNLHRCIKL